MHAFNPSQTLPHISPTKTLISNQSSVLVEIVSCAYSPAAEIDGSAPAQTLSTRVVDSLAGQLVLGRGLIAPVVWRSGGEGELEPLGAREIGGGLV